MLKYNKNTICIHPKSFRVEIGTMAPDLKIFSNLTEIHIEKNLKKPYIGKKPPKNLKKT